MNRGFRTVVVALVAVVGGVFFAAARVFAPTLYEPPVAATPAAPDAPFDVGPFEALMARFGRDDGGADYAAWRADAEATRALDLFLADVAAASPRATPARFPDATHAARYWLHAASAAQIRVVLETGVASVLDLPARWAVAPGDGLLRRRAFRCGGETHTVLKIFAERLPEATSDRRVVFALGGVAPALGPMARSIPTGPAFDAFLAARVAAFFADPREARVDAARGELRLATRLFRFRDLLAPRTGPGVADAASFDAALDRAVPAEVLAAFAPSAGGAPLRRVRGDEDWRVR